MENLYVSSNWKESKVLIGIVDKITRKQNDKNGEQIFFNYEFLIILHILYVKIRVFSYKRNSTEENLPCKIISQVVKKLELYYMKLPILY